MADTKRVLVAEDNDANYSLVAYVLARQGLAVYRARDGQETLEMASEDPPDLLLMDVQMPKIDGLEVTRRLRQLPATHSLPIVVVTALAMRGDQQRAVAAGCDAYLAKPVSPTQLIEMTQRFLAPTNGDS
ncbi:MAG TPA: response regulator [Chloroflexota bacterium]